MQQRSSPRGNELPGIKVSVLYCMIKNVYKNQLGSTSSVRAHHGDRRAKQQQQYREIACRRTSSTFPRRSLIEEEAAHVGRWREFTLPSYGRVRWRREIVRKSGNAEDEEMKRRRARDTCKSETAPEGCQILVEAVPRCPHATPLARLPLSMDLRPSPSLNRLSRPSLLLLA